jgi:hypothetical protein
MAKITYLLGAGASYNSCPILEKQAEMMIEIAKKEIYRLELTRENDGTLKNYDFSNKIYLDISEKNEYKILWYIGYFGEKAKEFSTIDIYARKLYLNREWEEYRLLKMAVSIFFDLWENFYFKQFKTDETNYFKKIDNRYKSLFSVLLNDNDGNIELNSDFKFLTWNYDLQLEETFKLFLGDKNDLHNVDKSLKFKSDNRENNVLHFNGYRGFYLIDGEEILINNNFDLHSDYWNNLEGFYDAIKRKKISFNNHIKYAWEHKSEDVFFNKMNDIIKETELLVIIGYSFPAFNRKIDQGLFENLNKQKVKKIVYQDPNATKELILNLFRNPKDIENKIEILNDEKSLKQFYLPNDYFINQENNKGKYHVYS